MKPRLFTLASLLLATLSSADPIAILGPIDTAAIEEPQRSAAPKGSFLAHYKAFLNTDRSFDKSMPLVNPPDWGKTLSKATGGSIAFRKSFEGGFVGHLTLEGLEPNHDYRLTLNGNPQRAGNDLLPTPVPGLPSEHFYDFLDIASDEEGRYESTLGIELQPGPYDVRLYVKDTADWKIVLYRDFFEFEVK